MQSPVDFPPSAEEVELEQHRQSCEEGCQEATRVHHCPEANAIHERYVREAHQVVE